MTEPHARLRIELQEIEPKVVRRVDVPLSSTLLALHRIIQITFDWWDYHLFEFLVGDRRYGEPMADADPDDRRVYRAAGIRLRTLVDGGIDTFLYVYDFGDDWRHDIVIESVGDGETDVEYPTFVAGERRAPLEDVGGVPGFMEFLEAVLDPLHEGTRGHGHLVREALRSGRHRRTTDTSRALRVGRPTTGSLAEASQASNGLRSSGTAVDLAQSWL